MEAFGFKPRASNFFGSLSFLLRSPKHGLSLRFRNMREARVHGCCGAKLPRCLEISFYLQPADS
jgi:hypothetical protein